MGIVFAEMSSWTALAWYIVMKTAFKTKSMKSESFCNIYYEDFKFQELLEKMHIKKNAAHNNKELIELSYSATVVLVCIFV